MAGLDDLAQQINRDHMRKQFERAYKEGQQASNFGYAEIPAEPHVDTPREALFRLHEVLTSKALDIMRAKNHDYASQGDPYRNFRTFGLLGVLVRMSDKLARLRSFEEQGVTKVADESITDTIIDIVNYAVIFEAMRREEASTGKVTDR